MMLRWLQKIALESHLARASLGSPLATLPLARLGQKLEMVTMVDDGCVEAWCWEKMALGFGDLMVGWRLLAVI